jgi:protein-tyrosine phosphatase
LIAFSSRSRFQANDIDGNLNDEHPMIPNWRDVGEAVNLITGKTVLLKGQLFRGGSINQLFSRDELPPVGTIVNLRKGRDRTFDRVTNIHIPATDTLDNYLTQNHKIQGWINQVLSAMCFRAEWPLLLHCTAGKDRTGVVVATILKAVAIEDDVIKEEYLLSDGIKDPAYIDLALAGINRVNEYIYDPQVITILHKKLIL